MPPKTRLTAVPDAPPKVDSPKPPDLRVSVADAIKEMTWLTKSDQALKALALRLADEIETAIDLAAEVVVAWHEAGSDMSILRRLAKLEAQTSATEVVAKLGPQLQAALRDLGGTPAARAALVKEKPIGGRLANLQSSAQRKHHS